MYLRFRALVFLLFSFAFLSGCGDFTAPRGQKPVPLATTSDTENPYVYGRGERLLVFAAVGGNVLDVNRNTGPIVDYLGRKLGVRFRLEYRRRYPEIIQSLVQGKADFAWLGPTTYLAIRKTVACIPVAQILRNDLGYYEGVIIVKSSAPYLSLDDLKGSRLAFIDRKSTSGYIYPLWYFKKKGIVPETFFKSTDFSGGHSNAVLRLISGKYDAICSERDILKRMAEKADVSKLRILCVTGRIPNGPIAAHPDTSVKLVEKAAEVLTGMASDEEGGKLLQLLRKKSNFSGFGPVNEATYDEVQKVLSSGAAK